MAKTLTDKEVKEIVEKLDSIKEELKELKKSDI